MRVLVACEYSGVVRDAFRARGHDAISCDLRPTLQGGPHAQGDVRAVLRHPWDLVIAHPPCTYLSKLSCTGGGGAAKRAALPETRQAADFFLQCLNANAPRVAVENPTMYRQAREMVGGPPSFAIHPWMYGHPYSKRTAFWVRGLPPLMATLVHTERKVWVGTRQVHGYRKHRDEHSLTFTGIARAMAQQWG